MGDSLVDELDILRLTANLSTVPTNTDGYAGSIGVREADISRYLSGAGRGTVVESLDYGLHFGISGTTSKPDVYYIDDTTLLTAAPILKMRSPDIPIIYQLSDQRLFGLESYHFESSWKGLVRRIDREIDYRLLRRALRTAIDGVLAFSPLCAEISREISPETPTQVIGPYVHPPLYNELQSVEPALDRPVAITIARGIDAKGVDLLVEAWPCVREEVPNAKLEIIGPGHPPEFEEYPGVTVHGRVEHESIPNFLKRASVFVCPSRFDAHPIAVGEAMCAGLPPLVTETTGAKVIIKSLDKLLVTEVSQVGLANAIKRYFSLPQKRRQALSRSARDLSEQYRCERRKREFRNKFESLFREVNQSS